MFCTICGASNEPGTIFCVSCGTKILTVDKRQQPEEILFASTTGTVKRKFGKKTLTIVGSAAGLLLLIVLLVVPRQVTVELAIDAKYGGVFESDCSISTEGAAAIGNQVSAMQIGSSSENSQKASLAFRKNSLGNCSGFATLTLEPFSTYRLVTTEEVGSTIGYRIFPTSVLANQKVEIKHKVTVEMNLAVEHDYCTGNMNNWTCYGGSSLHANDSTCYGVYGYSDIRKGASVIITGNSNGLTVRGKLKNGTDWDLDSIDNAVVTCHLLSNSISVPHDDAGYSIEVANRGSVEFALTDLKSESWVAKVHLGD